MLQINQFHIYDMSQNGASVVRQFADGQGFDIIASGNGYMNGYQDVTGTGQGSPVYSVSSELFLSFCFLRLGFGASSSLINKSGMNTIIKRIAPADMARYMPGGFCI